MRKTNKKLSKLVDDKSGVILVTVIFIVAMALVFITTALTISIANRQRVYSNATSDQARLTVTSLSQALWQAIYSQQINDQMLYNLAKGSTNNGSLVTFTSADVPGMGQGGSVATAYFYLIQDSNPATHTFRKIGIECKCEIDGVAQYYTMVLQENQGESMPPKMFNFVVNLGDGGILNRCSIGMTVGSCSNDRSSSVRYNDPDNVVFIHQNTQNTAEGLGLYSTVITDGYLRAFDTAIIGDVYCLGENSGLLFGNNPNLIRSNAGQGNVYFWGSRIPFAQLAADGVSYRSVGDQQININQGVSNMYFDTRETQDEHGNTVYTGFENFSMTIEPQTLNGLNNSSGRFYYDSPNVRSHLGYRNGGDTSGRWSLQSNANWVEANGMDDYLTTDPDLIDTIDELVGPNGYQTELALAAQPGHTLNMSTVSGLSAGVYLVDSSATITRTINCDLSGGNVIIVLDDNVTLTMNEGGYIIMTHGGSGDLIFLLKSGAEIRFNDDARSGSGIVDLDCFTGAYTSAANIDQTTVPRCKIFSLYTGGTPVGFYGNAGNTLTAFLGFFPQDSSTTGGGGKLYVNAGGTGLVYYGRISAGGINEIGGSPLNIPYCPNEPSSQDSRDYAYRDATNYSVCTDECGYFTA